MCVPFGLFNEITTEINQETNSYTIKTINMLTIRTNEADIYDENNEIMLGTALIRDGHLRLCDKCNIGYYFLSNTLINNTRMVECTNRFACTFSQSIEIFDDSEINEG